MWLALFFFLECSSSYRTHEAVHGSSSIEIDEGGEDADRMLSGLTMCNGVLHFSKGGRCLKMILFLMCVPHVLLGDVLILFLLGWYLPFISRFHLSFSPHCVHPASSAEITCQWAGDFQGRSLRSTFPL